MFGRIPLWLCEDITANCYMYCYFRNSDDPGARLRSQGALREITVRRGRTLVCTAGCPSCHSSYLTLQVAEVNFG